MRWLFFCCAAQLLCACDGAVEPVDASDESVGDEGIHNDSGSYCSPSIAPGDPCTPPPPNADPNCVTNQAMLPTCDGGVAPAYALVVCVDGKWIINQPGLDAAICPDT